MTRLIGLQAKKNELNHDAGNKASCPRRDEVLASSSDNWLDTGLET